MALGCPGTVPVDDDFAEDDDVAGDDDVSGDDDATGDDDMGDDDTACPLGAGPECPAVSCAEVLGDQPAATDGLYWLGDPGPDAFEAHCDMSEGGWTLVYRATNSGVAENATIDSGDAYGSTPITPTSVGEHKLSDVVINSMRGGAVLNDIKLAIHLDSQLLGQSWHRSDCVLQSGTALPAEDVCNQSTTVGKDSSDYAQSGHWGAVTRWYVDADFGYVWPLIHIGPVPGGTSHGENLPDPYCTWYDERTCPVSSEFEMWVH